MTTTRTLTTNFSGSAIETWQFIEHLAKENGFNPYYKYDYAVTWPKYTDPGVTVYEEFLYNSNERIHIIVENDRKKRVNNIKLKNLFINN